MRRCWRMVGAACLATLAIACRADPPAPRILCVGDSITLGTTRGGERDGVDPEGGYPGRLARVLGARARVLRRAAGGATAAMWLESPRDGTGRVLATALDEIGPPLPPAAWSAPRVVDGVLDADRPDVVVVVLGTNDLMDSRAEPADAAVEQVLARLRSLRDVVAAHGARALVATVLPTRRPTAARVAQLDQRLRVAAPDVVDLAAGFEAAGGLALLGDDVHPSEAGYECLAGLLEQALVTRGMVAAR
ncbi:MAG TPA: SGNH/GDSL hydrolase family protein [Candidatus Eisenbacteria bacterium]|nr:SGNH/GDSL hydrolase family protein [Candidatus Eisenbacteria bacterium]